MPQIPAMAVGTAMMAPQAARRLVVSDSSIVTIDRLTWMAVPMVSRIASTDALIRDR